MKMIITCLFRVIVIYEPLSSAQKLAVVAEVGSLLKYKILACVFVEFSQNTNF